MQQLEQKISQLMSEQDSMSSTLENRESQLLGLHAQVDLLRNHGCETEAWLTSM